MTPAAAMSTAVDADKCFGITLGNGNDNGPSYLLQLQPAILMLAFTRGAPSTAKPPTYNVGPRLHGVQARSFTASKVIA